MGQIEPQPRRYTPEEYFALEEQSQEKHEYFDGEIFAMAGSSKKHNMLITNAMISLRAALNGSGCQVFTSDIKLVVKKNFYYTYPDVVVSCDPADQCDGYLVRQPVLLVDIVPPAVKDDRREKYRYYQKIPSLRHYLLVSKVAWAVKLLWRNTAGQWLCTRLTGPTAVLEIPDLNLHLPLAELYASTGVVLPGVG